MQEQNTVKANWKVHQTWTNGKWSPKTTIPPHMWIILYSPLVMHFSFVIVMNIFIQSLKYYQCPLSVKILNMKCTGFNMVLISFIYIELLYVRQNYEIQNQDTTVLFNQEVNRWRDKRAAIPYTVYSILNQNGQILSSYPCHMLYYLKFSIKISSLDQMMSDSILLYTLI